MSDEPTNAELLRNLVDSWRTSEGEHERLRPLADAIERITPEMIAEVHQDWCAAAYSAEKECGCGRAPISAILAALSGHHDPRRRPQHPRNVGSEPATE